MADPVTQPLKIVIINDSGEKLVGLLQDTGSKEVIILCHGFTASKDDGVMVNICVALEKEGISAFRFDFSGNGNLILVIRITLTIGTTQVRRTLGVAGFKPIADLTARESDGSFSFGNYMKEVEDLHAVVKHFNGANRIVSAIVGHSKGGDVVLLYASKYHDVRTVVNLSGRYDLKKGIVEKLGDSFTERIKKEGYIDVKKGKVTYRVTMEGLMDRLNIDMHEACLKIDKECRVFTVHGSADEVIPVEDAYQFSKIIRNHKLHIIEGANHCYTEHQAELASVVMDFINACLRQDKGTSG